MGDNDIPDCNPASTFHPLFAQNRESPDFSHHPLPPFFKCKNSHRHLYLNPARSKEGPRSSGVGFLSGGCDFRQQQGGRSTCWQPPPSLREAARRPQAAEEREGAEQAPLAKSVLCCLITQGVIVYPNQCLELYL